jgi:NIMA (never in mitosis gene a)-related kinase
MPSHGFLLVCLAATASSVHGFVAAAPRSPLRAAAALRATPPQALVEDSGMLLALVEVAPTSFNLALGSLALGSVFGVPGSPLKNRVTAFVPGALLALFGAFLIFQTATLRFTFDETQFSLVRADLSSTGENVVVGGENRWAYDKFVNYDFFPSESLPILVYFKETQTAEDQWDVGPGEQANSAEAIAKGAKRGQVHFFPAIADVSYLKAGFKTHGCAKL